MRAFRNDRLSESGGRKAGKLEGLQLATSAVGEEARIPGRERLDMEGELSTPSHLPRLERPRGGACGGG
jgi:hypothetical protein